MGVHDDAETHLTSHRPVGRIGRPPLGIRRCIRRFALPLILLLACGLRLLVALNIPLDPSNQYHYDASWYDMTARHLAHGRGFVGAHGRPVVKWPPGYPLLLSAVYRLPGESILNAKLLNVLMATATCFVTFAIGRRAYAASTGLLAALLLAASPGDVFYAPILLSEVAFQLALTLLVYAFLVFDRNAVGIAGGRWLLLGLFIGAAALIRGPGIFFLPVPIAAWWLASVPRRTVLVRGLLCLAGVAIALAPWAIRNQRAFGSPILISTNGSWVLFDSHSPVATGAHSQVAGRFRKEQFAELSKLPRRQRIVEVSKQEVRAALRFAISHPVEELILAPQRLYHLFAGDDFSVRLSQRAFERPDGIWSQKVNMRFTGLAMLANAYFAILTVFALLGFTRVWSRVSRHAVAIPLVVLVFVLMHTFVFLGGMRFHLPFVPLLAILAAVAVDGRRRPWPLGEARASGD
jgi:4-amino-4-deoxy-L-arabinose transferase-like glycosyltransferase